MEQPAHFPVTGAIDVAIDATLRRCTEVPVPEITRPVVEQHIIGAERLSAKRQVPPDHVADPGAGRLVDDTGEGDIDRNVAPRI